MQTFVPFIFCMCVCVCERVTCGWVLLFLNQCDSLLTRPTSRLRNRFCSGTAPKMVQSFSSFFFLFGTWLDVKFESGGEEEEVLLATSYGCVAHKLEERKYEKVWERRESSRMLQISTQKLYSLGPTTYSCVSPEWCLFGGFGISGTWNNAYVCGAHKLCRAWN